MMSSKYKVCSVELFGRDWRKELPVFLCWLRKYALQKTPMRKEGCPYIYDGLTKAIDRELRSVDLIVNVPGSGYNIV